MLYPSLPEKLTQRRANWLNLHSVKSKLETFNRCLEEHLPHPSLRFRSSMEREQ
jgi:hypothetical protein